MKTTCLAVAILTGALALAGCATVNEAAVQALSETQYASLNGQEVVGGAGDADGTASAQISTSQEAGRVCLDLRDQRNLGTVTAVSVRQAARGQSGPVAVSFTPTEDGEWKGCAKVASDAIQRGIDKNPTAYYVQADTSTGSVRGQLSDEM